jgi:hypothetical protein
LLWKRSAAGIELERFPERRFSSHPILERDGSMDAIMNFLGQTWVMVGMGVALIALIGVMIFLRMKPRDED